MPAIKTGSQTIWYDECGQGHPVLLVPGLGASRFSWWKQINPLSQRFRVLNMDNRDAGDSAPGTGPYTIAEMADDAAGLLQALDCGPAYVVGWSMGSFISLELTLRHPALVERLILVAGSPGGAPSVTAAPEIRALLVRSEAEEIEARVRRTYPLLAGPGYMDAHPEDLDHLVQSFRARPMAYASYQRQLGAVASWKGVGPSLDRIVVPTLVVHGDADPLIPFPNGQYLAAHVPGATLSTYAGVGHLPPIEAADRFNREVLAFL